MQELKKRSVTYQKAVVELEDLRDETFAKGSKAEKQRAKERSAMTSKLIKTNAEMEIQENEEKRIEDTFWKEEDKFIKMTKALHNENVGKEGQSKCMLRLTVAVVNVKREIRKSRERWEQELEKVRTEQLKVDNKL